VLVNFYLETNLIPGIYYERRIKAKNSTFETNVSTYTVITLSQYRKDIDNDGAYEYFIDSTSSLSDDFGDKTAVSKSVVGRKVFFYVRDAGSTTENEFATNVWIVDDDYVADLEILDVNGDGSLDYLYKSKNSNLYDRFFDRALDSDLSLGIIKGKVLNQSGVQVASANMTIYTSSDTVEAITDAEGDFEISLPVTYGQQTKVVIEKTGCEKYEAYFDFVNGEEIEIIL